MKVNDVSCLQCGVVYDANRYPRVCPHMGAGHHTTARFTSADFEDFTDAVQISDRHRSALQQAADTEAALVKFMKWRLSQSIGVSGSNILTKWNELGLNR